MKTTRTIALTLALSAPAVLPEHGILRVHAQTGESVSHREASFEFEIKAPYAEVAPLFGAQGERAWGGADWDPRFLFPSPAQDVPGAVFTVEHGGHRSFWMTPTFDLARRHIQHVVVTEDAVMSLIDVTFPPAAPHATRVHVTYQRTALSSMYNSHVESLSAQDAAQGPEWKSAIEAYIHSHRDVPR